jgi:hypothetical protein
MFKKFLKSSVLLNFVIFNVYTALTLAFVLWRIFDNSSIFVSEAQYVVVIIFLTFGLLISCIYFQHKYFSSLKNHFISSLKLLGLTILSPFLPGFLLSFVIFNSIGSQSSVGAENFGNIGGAILVFFLMVGITIAIAIYNLILLISGVIISLSKNDTT